VRSYRAEIRELSGTSNLSVWYARLDATGFRTVFAQEAAPKDVKRFDKNVSKARAKDSTRAFSKLTYMDNGEPRIISDPPLIVPIEEIFSDTDREQLENTLHEVLRRYRSSLPNDRRHLLEQFRMVHVARKVVGVGSVGTRAWIVLLLGRDNDDPLFLQLKEAQDSVLARFVGKSEYDNQGRRVVEGQRLMQAASDVFLGWVNTEGLIGVSRDFYARQLWDWKTSADIDLMTPAMMNIYAQACGWTLARAHARSGDRVAIAEYLGNSDTFDRAIAEFSEAYADQNERDYAAFTAAIDSGRLVAEKGL